jgi:fibronectin-binding autotransporter adhesin
MQYPARCLRPFLIIIALILFLLPFSAGATDFGGASQTINSNITDGLNGLDNSLNSPPTTLTIANGVVVTNPFVNVGNPGGPGVNFNGFDYILLNQGSITGQTDGVTSTFGGGSDVTVNNEGSIIGIDDDGVFLGNTGTVTNNTAGASILGNIYGVWIQNNGVVENNGAGATITSMNLNGVDVGASGMVTNGGLGSMITGGQNGVFVSSSGVVINSGEGAIITGNGGAGILLNFGGTVTNSGLGAMITGTVDGILLNSGGIVDNTGTNAAISGATNGVRVTTDIGTVNNSGNTAMITGGVNGINFAAGGTVNNSGPNATITGTAGAGVFAIGGPANITNSATATITGATGGIVTGTSADTIVNDGMVISTGVFSAIFTSSGNDSITIRGTVTSGGAASAIDAGANDDIINLQSGASINNDIDGGADTDIANLSGIGAFAHEFISIETLNMNSGTWTLTGSGHSIVDTQINNGGTLILDGANLSGTATVNTGGILMGDGGSFAGLLSTAGGTIAPGNSIGTFNADGAVNMNGGGTLEIEFTDTMNDILNVTGASDYSGGTVAFVPGAINVLPNIGDIAMFQFINGDVAIGAAEEFSSVALSPVFGHTITYNDVGDGDVTVEIERLFTFSSFANTPNRIPIAAILDDIQGGGVMGDAAVILQNVEGAVGLDGFRAALDQLTPETLASIPRVKLQEHRNFKESLVQRLGALRLGDDFSKNKGVAQLALANIDPAFLANYVTSAQRRGSTANRSEWKPFFRAYGAMSDLDTLEDHFGYEASTYGVTFGVDKRLSSNLSLGAAAGYGSSEINFDNFDSKSNMHTFHLAAFGEYSVNRFRLDAVASYAYSIIDMNRRIRFGALDRLAISEHNGNEFLIHGGAGYDFDLGGLLIGPVGSIEYLALIEDDFTERGAQSANLMIAGRTTDSFRTIAGLRAAKQFQFKKMMIVPEAHAKWTHEWLDNPQTLQAQFTGIPGPAFSTINRELPDDGANVGFGITGYQNEMAFNISYQSEFGRSDLINHVFDIGLKMSFF